MTDRYRDALDRCRRRMLRLAMRKFEGNVRCAAAYLALDRTSMHVMLRRYRVDRLEFRKPKSTY